MRNVFKSVQILKDPDNLSRQDIKLVKHRLFARAVKERAW